MKFIKGLERETNWKLTENDQLALKSTLNGLVDLFGTIGALRNRSEEEIISLFSKAFAEDRLLALKTLFFARNIRGLGLGERRTPRVIYRWLAIVYPEYIETNLHLIPKFGRWDDLYAFEGTSLEKQAFKLIKDQWKKDLDSLNKQKPVSLLGKWLKSVNTSSKESRRLGKLTAKYLGLSEKDYRTFLSLLRKRIDVVETKMSSNEWQNINYSSVPSKAMTNYRNAFFKQDGERFQKFLSGLKSGETKINASTLYPYDLISKINIGWDFQSAVYDEVIEAQWRALPNYIEGENNVLVVADTSSSMTWAKKGNVTPMDVSIGLAIYFAERNSGPYKNKFVTFSSEPSFVDLKGETLSEKISCIPNIISNTNLEAVFDLVLNTALENNLVEEELPKSIIVISDMEFDACVESNNARSYSDSKWTFYDSMKKKYEDKGYSIPNIVFWNVEARNNTYHAFSDYKGVQLASGASPSIFQLVIGNIGTTPKEFMLGVLNDELFSCVKLPVW